MAQHEYVHGYSEKEKARLRDQADTLASLLHHDSCYAPGSTVLEAGCGVGAQTVYLARNSPLARITSIDISPVSLEKAGRLAAQAGISNVRFQTADLFALPFGDGSFDHIFVCFVLEHLKEPVGALKALERVLKPGGSITVIEGDHGSTFFYPESDAAMAAVDCLVEVQARMGGDARIGRRLYPLLRGAGFQEVEVTPRMVYVDGGKPSWIEGFTKNTFTAMVEGVREQALGMKLIEPERWDEGIAGLRRTAESDGVFCYTFFKGKAVKL